MKDFGNPKFLYIIDYCYRNLHKKLNMLGRFSLLNDIYELRTYNYRLKATF